MENGTESICQWTDTDEYCVWDLVVRGMKKDSGTDSDERRL